MGKLLDLVGDVAGLLTITSRAEAPTGVTGRVAPRDSHADG